MRDPERYLPEFGGFCAIGVAANNARAPTNPETFRIQDGRLLLFFNGDYKGDHVDTSRMWDDDAPDLLSKADQNWPALRTNR